MVVDLTSGPEGQRFKYLSYPPDSREEVQPRCQPQACMYVHGSCSIYGMPGMCPIILVENLHADKNKGEAVPVM